MTVERLNAGYPSREGIEMCLPRKSIPGINGDMRDIKWHDAFWALWRIRLHTKMATGFRRAGMNETFT